MFVTVCRLQTPTNFICVSVCPAFTTYISLTMGQILIKLGENVLTLVQLIVSNFHRNQISFYVIMTSFLFSKVISKGSYSAQSKGKNSVQRETFMLRQSVTLATAIFLFNVLSKILKQLVPFNFIVGKTLNHCTYCLFPLEFG